MTKISPVAGQRDGDRGAAHEASITREQLVERTCAWCGEPVAYSGRGRPPRYCSPVHRSRAWELRTAQERAQRPVSDGGQTQEPVREVVQRVEKVVRAVARPEPVPIPPVPRPAQRLSGEPYTLPEDAVEWIEALAALRRDVDNPKIHPFRQHVARACMRTAEALLAEAPRTQRPSPSE